MLLDRIKQLHTDARKTGDKDGVSILSVVIGEVQTLQFRKGHASDVTDEEVIKIIKKLIEDNQEMIDRGKDELIKENKILASLLPQMVSKDEIRTALADLQRPEGEGQARGLAIKYLKSKGIFADSKDVIEVVAEFFQG